MPGACFPRPQVFPGPPDGAMQKFIISSKFCPDLHWPSMKLRKFWKKKRHRKHKPPKIKPQSQPHPHQTPAPPAPEAAHTQPHRRRPPQDKIGDKPQSQTSHNSQQRNNGQRHDTREHAREPRGRRFDVFQHRADQSEFQNFILRSRENFIISSKV